MGWRSDNLAQLRNNRRREAGVPARALLPEDSSALGFDRLFRAGCDTMEIARRTGFAESLIINTLHRMREARAVSRVHAHEGRAR